MAARVLRNFLVQPAGFLPLALHHSPSVQEEKRKTDEEEREDEEEDVTSEPADDEDDAVDVSLNPAPVAVDMTKQLLRFADLISRDVQRYFGRAPGELDSCDIYSDAVSVTTSGRMRYYDDLLRLVKAEGSQQASGGEAGLKSADGRLGPLAELFDQTGPTLAPPMSRRHLPLSFWTEPAPCCLLDGRTTEDKTPESNDNTHLLYSPSSYHNTHTLDSTQPDFSDLLAHWDQHPGLPHTLTDNTHLMQ